jgi:hypothetical protein
MYGVSARDLNRSWPEYNQPAWIWRSVEVPGHVPFKTKHYGGSILQPREEGNVDALGLRVFLIRTIDDYCIEVAACNAEARQQHGRTDKRACPSNGRIRIRMAELSGKITKTG